MDTGFLNDKILGLKTGVWLAILVVVSAAGIWYKVSQPAYATQRYGICKVFLEQYLRFPTTLTINQGGETRGSAVIRFSDVNPFGSQQVRTFECFFSQDAKGRTTLSRITMDRKAIAEEKIKFFQKEMPLLMVQELDNALPKDLPSNLLDYKD